MSDPWKKINLGKNNIGLEIDLTEMFGAQVPNSTQFRQAVGQALIDEIRSRTEEGHKSWNNDPFKKYSKEYKESLGFHAYGKTNDVTLKQSGAMLLSMDIIKESVDKIVIGWTDKEEAAKAYNHITGDTVPKRDFLGLRPSEMSKVRDEFFDEFMSMKDSIDVVSSVGSVGEFLSGGRTIQATQDISSIIDSIFNEGE